MQTGLASLVAALGDRDFTVRQIALGSLLIEGSQQLLDALPRSLESDTYDDRWLAVGLALLSSTESSDDLLGALSAFAPVRPQLLLGLANLPTQQLSPLVAALPISYGLDHTIAQRLEGLRTGDVYGEIRGRAAAVLGICGQAEPLALERMLRTEGSSQAAAGAAVGLDPTQSEEALLIAARTDPSAEVRSAAWWNLGLTDVRLEAMSDVDSSVRRSYAPLLAIDSGRDPRLLDFMANETDTTVKSTIAATILLLNEPALDGYLIRVLADAPDTRLADALRQIIEAEGLAVREHVANSILESGSKGFTYG